MKLTSIARMAAMASILVAQAACDAEAAQDQNPPVAEQVEPVQAPTGDIVAVAAGAGQFNTLVAAVTAAGLVETLQGTGPFTVFAPTDERSRSCPRAPSRRSSPTRRSSPRSLRITSSPGK
jgi:uncharacterized surface protein with fasciclin (FAS1) repeats